MKESEENGRKLHLITHRITYLRKFLDHLRSMFLTKGHGDREVYKSRKRMEENSNWRQNSQQWSLITSLQILFFWIVAKGKIRYILGVYTVLLTVSIKMMLSRMSFLKELP